MLVAVDGDDAAHLRAALLTYRARLAQQGQPVPEVVEHLLAYGRHVTDPDPPADGGRVWLSREQAARRAGVSPRTLDRWRGDGLDSARRGGRVVVHRDTLDAYLGQH